MKQNMNLYIGIDFGTSGARAVVVDVATTIKAEARYPFELAVDWVTIWRDALFSLLQQIPRELRREVRAIARFQQRIIIQLTFL